MFLKLCIMLLVTLPVSAMAGSYVTDKIDSVINWGKFFGNSEPLAPMDKGKPHQYGYNVVRSKLIHDFATDKGKSKKQIRS